MKIENIHLIIIIAIIFAAIIGYMYIGQHPTDEGQDNNSQENKTIEIGNDQSDNIEIGNNQSNKTIEIGTSKYNGKLDISNRHITLYNNIWGALGKELNSKILKLYIYYKPDGDFGWEWNRPDPNVGKYVPPVYPESVIGAIPTQRYSTTKIFPIKYGDIKEWTSEIEFHYVKSPTGKYNLAHDIYWMDKNTKKFNIMIWVAGHHDEKPIGIVSDGINEYIHYHREPGKGQYWDLHIFELKNQNTTNVKIDIKKLLENVVRNDNMNNSWVVPGVELGSEIWKGSGRIEIDRYVIGLNGQVVGQ